MDIQPIQKYKTLRKMDIQPIQKYKTLRGKLILNHRNVLFYILESWRAEFSYFLSNGERFKQRF